jgi:hypothetical protein
MSRITDAILKDGGNLKAADLIYSNRPGYVPPEPPSSVCPICSKDTPHEHTSAEVAEHHIKTKQRSKLHWHLVNMHHASAAGHSYYPSIVTGEGAELGYARGDVALLLIDEHNKAIDALLGFAKSHPPITVHARDQAPHRSAAREVTQVEDPGFQTGFRIP